MESNLSILFHLSNFYYKTDHFLWKLQVEYVCIYFFASRHHSWFLIHTYVLLAQLFAFTIHHSFLFFSSCLCTMCNMPYHVPWNEMLFLLIVIIIIYDFLLCLPDCLHDGLSLSIHMTNDVITIKNADIYFFGNVSYPLAI